MKRIAAALMLAASTSAQAQVYDPVEILPIEIPSTTTVSPSTPTNLGDDATQQVDLGFTFSYFGQDFTSAWISSNGFVSFQSPANLCCNGQPLEQAQRNTIYQYWTDLINWTGAPYYSRQKLDDGSNSLLVGWYNTYEYGGNKPTSFEMYLYDSGAITFNYINTYDMQGHTVTAGLTGPTAEDNILLFYGSNTGSLSGKAYSFNYQTGTVTVDCATTPMDPSCVVPAVTPVEVTPSIQEETAAAVVETLAQQVEQAAEEQIVQEETEVVVAAEEQTTTITETAATTASSSTSSTSTSSTTSTSSRLSPDQLAALNSRGASSLTEVGPGNTSITIDAQQSGIASSEASFQLFTAASSSSIAMAEQEQQEQLRASVESTDSSKSNQISQQSVQVEQSVSTSTTQEQTVASFSSQQSVEEDKSSLSIQIVEQTGSSIAATESRWQDSISSQSATLEVLNSFNVAQSEGREESGEPSSLGEGQAETISQMAYVAGFSAYKLVTLPDRPDFYKPRRIYKNNRPVDAYMSIFKMTAANDNLWKQMVESQYERRN